MPYRILIAIIAWQLLPVIAQRWPACPLGSSKSQPPQQQQNGPSTIYIGAVPDACTLRFANVSATSSSSNHAGSSPGLFVVQGLRNSSLGRPAAVELASVAAAAATGTAGTESDVLHITRGKQSNAAWMAHDTGRITGGVQTLIPDRMTSERSWQVHSNCWP
jgi:hypothetical protein